MEWTDRAQGLMEALGRMVPEALRQLAMLSAREEAEGIASSEGSGSVDVDEAMRGWIRTTPPEQRNGLIAVIESLGLEPERYAEDLENAEGWGEEYEEPPDSGM
ncbi:MAG TPA: hypothetical protein VJQ09_02030 [Candidatus Limnocylindria bacterium]|nr:hypothetical protein [Candidatus Limnocylindria bacterium]